MPEIAANPLFEHFRIVALPEHAFIVIEFQQQRVQAGEHATDVRRDSSDVGQQADAELSIRKDELTGFAGIVRNRDRRDMQVADCKRLVTGKTVQCGDLCQHLGGGVRRAVGRPDGDSVPPGNRANATDMIIVLVRDQDGGDIAAVESQSRQTFARGTSGEAAVHQERRGARLHDRRVASTATAE